MLPALLIVFLVERKFQLLISWPLAFSYAYFITEFLQFADGCFVVDLVNFTSVFWRYKYLKCMKEMGIHSYCLEKLKSLHRCSITQKNS